MADGTEKKSIESIDDINEVINSFQFSKNEYDIIVDLLSKTDDSLFTKILEEVYKGNLCWMDFKQFLSNTNYPSILVDELKTQTELSEYMKRLKDFRKSFKEANENLNNILNENALDTSSGDYSNEVNNIRKNLIYEITKQSPSDTPLTIAYKLYLYENLTSSNSNLNINNIFLFLNNYYIPVKWDSQVLNSYDRAYMTEYGIDEDQMKQIKSLSIMMRNGGNDDTSGT